MSAIQPSGEKRSRMRPALDCGGIDAGDERIGDRLAHVDADIVEARFDRPQHRPGGRGGRLGEAAVIGAQSPAPSPSARSM